MIVNKSVGTPAGALDEVEMNGERGISSTTPDSGLDYPRIGPRIALITPYTGGNYGDGAIQDAMIANMRSRFPSAQFSGISLSCDNFAERHGAEAFPLCATGTALYGMVGGTSQRTSRPIENSNRPQTTNLIDRWSRRLRNALGKTPAVGLCLRKARLWTVVVRREIIHSLNGYRFLRLHDLVVVSGGGQLDEEWGGPWGHPFALFKWAVLARIARVPFVFAGVGACRVTSITSRFFLSVALRAASYRSYRDKNSRTIAAGLFHRAARDPVVPDLAFSQPTSGQKPSHCIREIAGRRTIFALSPIAYAKPGSWPFEDPVLYSRYLEQMARVISQLIERDGFLVMVWSAIGDRQVIPEIIEHLDSRTRNRLSQQLHVPEIASWRDLVDVLYEVDFLIASRLHSTILGFVAHRPTVAISFDPKVDWLMDDLGQADFLLQIRDFEAGDVINALDRLEARKQSVMDGIRAYRQRAIPQITMQYDAIAGLAKAYHPHSS
jgi:polysaccharide pyruvyl transferase WcaK-like protein